MSWRETWEDAPTPEQLAEAEAGDDFPTVALLNAGLLLHQGWSNYRVFSALAARYPSEAELQGLFRDPEFVEALECLGRTLGEVKAQLDATGAFDGEQLARIIAARERDLYDSVEILCDFIGCAPDDLLSVFMRAPEFLGAVLKGTSVPG